MIGQTVSHYKITGKIGQGGMGVVYKADDTKLHRTVALKFLPPHLLAAEQEKARFIHEARAAAALDHPNICTIYEIDESDEHAFISMAYIEGETLKDIADRGPLKLDDAVKYASQVARGLEEAHAKGVVHRDIKSANVVVSKKGHAIVMDFGLAKLGGQTKITQSGTTVGTVSYMSPEQARGEDVDQRSDIWSLGVVLYHMISGRYPFEGDHQSAVMYAIMNERQEPLTALRTGVPMELERIVDKALAKNAAERYQSVTDMIVDLKAVRDRLEGGATSTGAAPSARGPSSRRGFFIGAAIFVVLAALYSFWRSDGWNDAARAPADDRVSIAVLPLDNMSRDEDQEYFADGMTEALIAELAQIRALRVISRTSVMRFKGSQQPLSEIAGALGVSTVIEGSVMQVGDRVRITAQLIDADTDEHLWAQSYERDANDILKLQGEVARAIAGEVEVELTPEDQARLASRAASDVDREAYDLYLRGRYHWNRRNEIDLNKALDLFTRATEIDPDYADAYAALAQTHLVLVNWSRVSASVAYPAAREAAEKALQIDPDNAAALAVLAGVAQEFDWDWDKAGELYRRSLEIEPGNAGVHQWYAEYLTQQGRFDEAFAEIELAKRLDPLALIVRTVVGWVYMIANRPEEAIEELEQIKEMDPDWIGTYLYIEHPYFMVGRERDGVEATLQYLRLTGNSDRADRIGQAYESGGIDAFWDQRIQELKQISASPGIVGFLYAYTGQADSAITYLERAYREHAYPIHVVAVSQWCKPIYGDPRFQALVKRMNLEHVKPAYDVP